MDGAWDCRGQRSVFGYEFNTHAYAVGSVVTLLNAVLHVPGCWAGQGSLGNEVKNDEYRVLYVEDTHKVGEAGQVESSNDCRPMLT